MDEKKKRKLIRKYRLITFLIVFFLLLVFVFSIYLIRHTNTSKDTETAQHSKSKKMINKTGNKETNYPTAPENNTQFSNLQDGKYKTSNGEILEVKNHTAYIDNILICNKTYALPSDYKPIDPYDKNFNGRGRDGSDRGLEKNVLDSFNKLSNDAKKENLNIYISSGYRSFDFQKELYDNCLKQYGKNYTDEFLSRPGASEHQSGLAFDLNSIDSSFDNTAEAKWVEQNAYKYGFCIRYPKGKEKFTGYTYESWHLRYVGKKLAKALFNNGNLISIEEYFGISSSY